jgi:hypothetical protein
MWEVSREPSTSRGSGDLSREAVLICGSAGIGDMLLGNGLGDGGVHSVSLSIESCSATGNRMN